MDSDRGTTSVHRPLADAGLRVSSNTLRFNGRTRQGLLNHLFSPLLRDVFAMRTAPLFTKQRFSLPALSQVLVPVAAFMGYSIAKIRAAVKPLPSEAFPGHSPAPVP